MNNNITPMHNHWIETRSGIQFNLLDPVASMVTIEDIAWGLSRISRFNGQTELPVPYSVADHSLWVTDYLYAVTGRADVALQGLLHDGHEAYTGDIVTQLKKLPTIMMMIVALQDRIQQAIHTALKLPCKIPALVEQADNMALSVEVQLMMPSKGEGWTLEPLDYLSRTIANPKCRRPMQGYQDFITRYRELSAETMHKPTVGTQGALSHE